MKECFEKVREENEVLFERQAAEIEAVNTRQQEHKAEADSGLLANQKLMETNNQDLIARIGCLEADMTGRIEANQVEAEKARAKIDQDFEDIRGRMAEHEARHEKAEAGLRLHEKAIEEVRREINDMKFVSLFDHCGRVHAISAVEFILSVL